MLFDFCYKQTTFAVKVKFAMQPNIVFIFYNKTSPSTSQQHRICIIPLMCMWYKGHAPISACDFTTAKREMNGIVYWKSKSEIIKKNVGAAV